MQTEGTDMPKIGDFPKLSRVSVRMLRHYDDIGLLEAARQRLRKEESMNYNVTIRTIPARYAATVHTEPFAAMKMKGPYGVPCDRNRSSEAC